MSSPAGRRTVALRRPGVSLTNFPGWRLRRRQVVVRAHRAGISPWWFASTPPPLEGRFDLPTPNGTCYVAVGRAAAEAALRERAGVTLSSLGWLSGAWCDETQVSRLEAPFGGRLADATDRRAAAFGVTREVSTTTRYDVTQSWAVGLHATGVSGIRYEPRFSSDVTAFSLALFGDAGLASHEPDTSPRGGREVAADAGIRVVDLPVSGRLTYQPAPNP